MKFIEAFANPNCDTPENKRDFEDAIVASKTIVRGRGRPITNPRQLRKKEIAMKGVLISLAVGRGICNACSRNDECLKLGEDQVEISSRIGADRQTIYGGHTLEEIADISKGMNPRYLGERFLDPDRLEADLG